MLRVTESSRGRRAALPMPLGPRGDLRGGWEVGEDFLAYRRYLQRPSLPLSLLPSLKKNRVIQEKKTDMNILHLPRHALADQDPTNTEETTETTDLPHITHKNTCKERKKMYTPPTQLAATPVDHRCGWRAAHLWNRHRESPATASRAEETMIFML